MPNAEVSGWKLGGTGIRPTASDQAHQTKHLTKTMPALSFHSERQSAAAAVAIVGADAARSWMTMTRRVKIGEAKTHLSALLAEVEAGEDMVICRGTTPVAHVTRIAGEGEHAALSAMLRRERAKQKAVTTSEILSWRHEGHAR